MSSFFFCLFVFTKTRNTKARVTLTFLTTLLYKETGVVTDKILGPVFWRLTHYSLVLGVFSA